MKPFAPLLSGLALAATLISSVQAGEGTVVSSLNTDMYSYIEVTQADKNLWIAGPKVSVKAGDKVQFPEGAMMSNFQSKQLQRTFPSVMFVQQIVVAGGK